VDSSTSDHPSWKCAHRFIIFFARAKSSFPAPIFVKLTSTAYGMLRNTSPSTRPLDELELEEEEEEDDDDDGGDDDDDDGDGGDGAGGHARDAPTCSRG
jgi:hypothetical protein